MMGGDGENLVPVYQIVHAAMIVLAAAEAVMGEDRGLDEAQRIVDRSRMVRGVADRKGGDAAALELERGWIGESMAHHVSFQKPPVIGGGDFRKQLVARPQID